MNDQKLGATGEFPEGKLNKSDEGELRLAVTAKDGNVIIAFGTPVTWMGMPPESARTLANSLLKQADKAEKEKGGSGG